MVDRRMLKYSGADAYTPTIVNAVSIYIDIVIKLNMIYWVLYVFIIVHIQNIIVLNRVYLHLTSHDV